MPKPDPVPGAVHPPDAEARVGRRRRGPRPLVLLLCLTVLVGLAGPAWAVTEMFRTVGDPRQRGVAAAERLARLASEQNGGPGRYYVPADWRSRSDDRGGTPTTACLRYEVRGSIDSSVADFHRTYRVGGQTATRAEMPRWAAELCPGRPPRPADVVFTQRYGDLTREVYVDYEQAAAPDADADAGPGPDPDPKHGSPAGSERDDAEPDHRTGDQPWRDARFENSAATVHVVAHRG